MPRLVLGTRGSALALWQANHVRDRLRELHPELEVQTEILQTHGDLQRDDPFGAGDRGVFVKTIEEALLCRKIDLAVHSLKDLPTEQPDGLSIVAVPKREDARDAIVSIHGWTFDELPAGSLLGTGSFRRRSQLLHRRPELTTEPIRGNVGTRIEKLRGGRYDAVVLAMAGLLRLGVQGVQVRPIDPGCCLPAVGQGALAVECRSDDRVTRELIEGVDHSASHAAVLAERAFLRRLGGGCLAPAAAHARWERDRLEIDAVVADVDGGELMRESVSCSAEEASVVALQLAERMLRGGADRLLQSAREDVDRDSAG